MALSESRIRWLWSDAHNDVSDRMAYEVFARAIEAEVSKQDDALIRQMLDALENHDGNYKLSKSSGAAVNAALTAARARLGETT